VAVRRGRFTSDLHRFSKVALDSSVLIYHLEGVEPYADLTEATFAAIGEGTPVAVLSTLSVTELLVQPFVEGRRDRVEAFERFILSLPNTELIAPSYAAAKEAARLRARYKIGTPDALLLATALTDRADGFLTNDRRLLRLKVEGISVVVLDDYT
jgi:predicted nucleic acid-binding protein